MSVVRSGEIRALSGLRIVAAVWVVLFHFRPLLHQASPPLSEALAPVLDCGAQGVDLFFILSGFVLTWNYLDKMGPTWSLRETLHFLWLRLARVWPVYLVTMHLAALWVIFTLNYGNFPSPEAANLTGPNYLRQLFLVQLWFVPFFDDTSWDGPAWSISAEWLAYLLFGLLVIVLFRVARVSRARTLLGLAFVATLPPLVFLAATGAFYTPWSWLPRIVMQFAAGALACAAVRKLRLTRRGELAAGYLALALVAAMVGLLYWFDAHPIASIRDDFGLADVFFLPLVVALAVGAGSLPAVLSTRALVYGGKVSFSLYMVHELVHQGFNWAGAQYRIDMAPSWSTKFVVLGLLVGSFAGAALLFHFVEEPARRWMRRMVSVPRVVDLDAKSDVTHRTLMPITDDDDTRSSRAG